MTSKTPDDFIIGALIGSAIGVAAALMLAPSSGESLRNKIVQGFNGTHAGRKPAKHTGRDSITSKLKKAAESKVEKKPARAPKRGTRKAAH